MDVWRQALAALLRRAMDREERIHLEWRLRDADWRLIAQIYGYG